MRVRTLCDVECTTRVITRVAVAAMTGSHTRVEATLSKNWG